MKRSGTLQQLYRALSLLSALLALSVSPPRAEGTIVPRGGEVFRGGEVVTISWDPNAFSGYVTIDLWNGARSRFSSIASGIEAGKGSFVWQVPADMEGYLFRVKVTGIRGDFYAMSGTYFTIAPRQGQSQPASSTLAGGGGEVFVRSLQSVGTEIVQVSWKSGEARRVDLYNVSGELIHRLHGDWSAGNAVDIDVASLPRGVYFVHVRYEFQVATTRFVLQ